MLKDVEVGVNQSNLGLLTTKPPSEALASKISGFLPRG